MKRFMVPIETRNLRLILDLVSEVESITVLSIVDYPHSTLSIDKWMFLLVFGLTGKKDAGGLFVVLVFLAPVT